MSSTESDCVPATVRSYWRAEAYKQKASAENGIESVRKNAPDDGRYDRKDAASGKPMFNPDRP